MAPSSLTSPAIDPVSNSQPGPPDVLDAPPTTVKGTAKPLDILFLQDATGSQGPYINSARVAINDICTKVSSSAALSKESLRFGLVAFRDHPPQDRTFVTKNFGFTKDTAVMVKNLASLNATGGGDGPEASTAALAEALNMEWEQDAVKIVVLITDAPPHGIGENGDGFPDGSPDQNDPLEIVRQMAEKGITLFVIACEPSLSQHYQNAVDFYRALCQITSGKMVPLLNAAQLGDYIVGSAIETMETEALISEYEKVILEDVYGQGKSLDEVMTEVQAKMDSNKKEIKTFVVEDVYAPSEAANRNAMMWQQASNIKKRGNLETVAPGSRLKAEFAATSAPFGGSIPFSATSDSGPWTRKRSAGRTPAPVTDMSSPPLFAAPTGSLFSGIPAPRSSAGPSPPGAAPLQGMPPPPAPPTPLMRGGALFGAAAPQPLQQAPRAQVMSQQVDQSQTRRVVMQSLMRNAKVGPGGVLTPTGDYAGSKAVRTDETLSAAGPSGGDDKMDTSGA